MPWVVGIHGLGDSPRGISRLFARLSLRAHVHLPQGLHSRGSGYDWFGVSIGGEEQALAAAVREAAERLWHSIEALAMDKRNLGKPVVTGFSQGGILSFAPAALHSEQLSASLPIAGWFPPTLMPETPVDLRGLQASSLQASRFRRANVMPAVARASCLRICANSSQRVVGSAVAALDMVSF